MIASLSKPVLAIVPGWGGSRATWQSFIDKAQEKFEVLCIELPGFGHTPLPTTVWGVDEYANFVEKKLTMLAGKKIVLLGHSFGGQVSTVVAYRYPDRFQWLVLSGAAVYRPSQNIRRIIFSIIAKAGDWVFRIPGLNKFSTQAKKVLYRVADSPDYAATMGIQRDIFRKVIREDVSAFLPEIQHPTLVVWGTRDQYVPVALGKKIAQRLPHGTLHLFPNAGHGLHHDAPDTLLETIDVFVREHPLP